MSKKKGMNSYVKYFAVMLVCAACGGVFGFCVSYFDGLSEVDLGAGEFLKLVRTNILPLLAIFSVLAVVCNEAILIRMGRIGRALPDAEDEECDYLEYALDRIGNLGVILCNVFLIGSLLILSTGYSIEYIETAVESEGVRLIAGMCLFILINVYIGTWQMRYVKLIQRIYPEKKGDPASRKFQEQWLKSCDEAERETIYQSSYKTYIRLAKCFPFFALIAMLCHLMWNTGIMAVVMVCALWLVTSVTYCRNCLTKKREKLRE